MYVCPGHILLVTVFLLLRSLLIVGYVFAGMYVNTHASLFNQGKVWRLDLYGVASTKFVEQRFHSGFTRFLRGQRRIDSFPGLAREWGKSDEVG